MPTNNTPPTHVPTQATQPIRSDNQNHLTAALLQFSPIDKQSLELSATDSAAAATTPESTNNDTGKLNDASKLDAESNFEQTERWIRAAAAQQAKLIVLPELHRGRYFCQTANADHFDYAEPLNGPTATFLGKLAKELDVVIVGSIFEKRMSGLYHNTAIVFDKSDVLAGFYRKVHIPDDPGYYEKFYFTPGDQEHGFKPIATSEGTLGVLICWDQWFPEAARAMALAGADILIYPTAIGWDPADTKEEQLRQLDAWQTVQRGHAVANGLPLLACNRTGYEPDPSKQTQGAQFWGHSIAVGPQGEWLNECPPVSRIPSENNTTLSQESTSQSEQTQEQLIVVHIDRNRTESVRRIWPFFRDRRTDAYTPLLKRHI